MTNEGEFFTDNFFIFCNLMFFETTQRFETVLKRYINAIELNYMEVIIVMNDYVYVGGYEFLFSSFFSLTVVSIMWRWQKRK